MKAKTTMRINFLVKMIMIMLFVLGVFIFFADISKAAEWVNDPANCSAKLGAVDCTGGGLTNKICGISGGSGICYSPMTKAQLSPTYNSLSQTRYSSSFTGGFVLDCQASALTGDTEPYCNNTTTPGVNALWCNASSTCLNSYNILTRCFAGAWAGETGSSECATTSVHAPGSPAADNCRTGYVSCDGVVTDCEVRIGYDACTGAGGLQGTINSSCECVVATSTFITGVQTHFSTSSPLLWGSQYGDGDLINITRNGVATSSFVVFNSGQVAIGHNINVSTTSVAFEVSSTQRGILIPRLGGNPANGIDGELYYDSVSKKFKYYNGDTMTWGELGGGLPSGSIGQILVNNGEENWVTSSVIYVNTTTARVGIGITDPTSTLHIIGTSTISQGIVLGDNSILGFYGGVIKKLIDSSNNLNGLIYEAPAAPKFLAPPLIGTHDFYTSKSTSESLNLIMRIRGDNVSIGTTTANARLSIQSNSTNDILNLFETGGQEVFTVLESGNVGVGTTNPLAKLHIAGDGAILATGTYNLAGGWTGDSLGAGTRLMWIPRKAAFRAGDVIGNQWDTTNIGNYSVAFGRDNIASGLFSAAFGWSSVASGTNSFAVGNASRATRSNAISMGLNTLAQGTESIALGSSIEVYANNSVGIGLTTTWPYYEINQSNTMAIMGGNVGIGTTSPIFKLTLGEDGGIYSAWPDYDPLSGLSGQTAPNFSTTGTLMFWYPRKGAFRAGALAQAQPGGDAWNDNNIGIISFAAGANNVASATGTFVAGVSNSSTAQYSAIVGGVSNGISGQYGNSFIGGGYQNYILSRQSSFIGGGYNNIISGASLDYGFIGGGQNNRITASNAFIGGGINNVANGNASFVGGGRNNTSSGQYSASFGYGNEVSGNFSFVSGQMNEVSGYNSVAFGNKMNVSGAYSFGINLEPDDEGGVVNLSNDRVLAVMGGNVGIGTTNPLAKLHITDDGSILATGTFGSGWTGDSLGAGTRLMWIPEKAAFRAGYVNGTEWNSINIGVYSAVFGRNNTALGSASFVGGGNYNKSTGGNSFVGGGYDNTAEGGSSFIGSGDYNIASSTGSFVGAGYRNKSAGQYSFIGGGYYNEVKNLNSFVGSGAYNLASGTYSFAGGGQYSYALGDNSFVGGGQYNNASGDNAFVGGGYSNVASGTYSFVGGGYDNVAGGSYSSAFGRNATVNGSYSMGINLASTAFTLNNANTMAIMGGKVGIGTVAPVASLHLAGDGSILATGTLNSGWDGGTLGAGTRLMWIPEKAAFRAGYVGGTQWNSSNIGDYSTAFGYSSIASGINSTVFGRNMTVSGARSFGISLAESSSYTVSEDNVMAIMGGDVGIGVASPDAKLHVITSGGDYAAILTGGYVGINTSTPSYQLDVWRSTNGNTVRISDPDGVCLLNPSASGWSCSSDERLKREILNINKGLQEILAIRPVNYYWKNNPEDNLYKTGFIAQELKEVIPEAVFLEEQTGYFTVNETVLIPILVKAVQEQQAEIEALREAVSTTLSIQQSGGQLTYSGGDLDLQNYTLLNVKNIIGTDNKWAIDENGQFITRIQTSGGNTKEMFAMQSPYSEFVFSSSSELINGEAIINFDPDTCELIDETQPLKVNITLTGECGGIFVKEKTATGFTVKELGGGNSSSTFDWMVIAKRKFATTTPPAEEPTPPAEAEPLTEPSSGDGEPTTTPETPVEPLVEEPTSTPEISPEPPIEEPTTTPEVLPEPPIEEPSVEAEPLTEQSSGDGEETPPVEDPTPPVEETP